MHNLRAHSKVIDLYLVDLTVINMSCNTNTKSNFSLQDKLITLIARIMQVQVIMQEIIVAMVPEIMAAQETIH